MIQIFNTVDKQIEEEFVDFTGGFTFRNKWLHLENPTDREIELIERLTGVDSDMLKAALEGSASAKAPNAVIYATSNRRHIIRERFSDREGDDIHRNDAMQEMISLSDRFGLHISFNKPDKNTYLDIVAKLAEQSGAGSFDDEMAASAERFALELADVIMCTLLAADAEGVDIEKALAVCLGKNIRRGCTGTGGYVTGEV